MKLRKIIATFLVIVMTAIFFVGCGMFTKNNEKLLDLIVAEINEGEYQEQITRRELIVYFYNNNGSEYVNQGQSLETVLTAFLDQLVSRKVFFIEAKKNLPKDTSSGAFKTKYADIKGSEYLSNQELEYAELEVEYSTIERQQSFMTTVLNEWYPLPETAGTVEEKTYNAAPNPKPEADPKPPKAPKPWEMPVQYFKGQPDEAQLRTALEAQIRAEALLRLRLQVEAEGMTEEEFQEKQITAMVEQKIIEKYRDEIYEGIKTDLLTNSGEQLEELFEKLRREQIKQFGLDPEAFFSKAASPADGDFLLYYPNFETSTAFKYVSVKNLLVKFDSDTEARLNELKEMMSPDYDDPNDPFFAFRDELLKYLVAKDRRDPYDWDITEDDLYDTIGEDEDGNKTEDFDILDFFNFIVAELDAVSTTDTAKRVEKFVELIFAYGEDPGMFNNNHDYVVAPIPVMGKNETYVTEFAAKAREFTSIGQIDFVVTDFGLHILLCTDIVEVTPVAGVEIAFSYDDIVNKNYDSVSYKFFNHIFTTKKETVLSRLQEQLNLDYLSSVTKYIENIEDLWAA